MTQSIALVSLVVREYDEAIAFYVGKLGFQLIEDSYVAAHDKRWVVVAPPGAGSCRLLLARASNPEQQSRIGYQTGGRVFLFLATDNFQRDYAAYRAKGVEFVRPPREEPYGTVAVFKDLYGNLWDLIQHREPALTLGKNQEFAVRAIGHVESPLRSREEAPKQGEEGSPLAVIVFNPSVGAGLETIRAGDRLLLLTWLDRADREVLSVHPRDDRTQPRRGVFSTRSQDRPNPIGVHRVTVVSVLDPLRFQVRNLEAFDQTPIIDVKSMLEGVVE